MAAFADQVALAIERARLAEQAAGGLVGATDKLRQPAQLHLARRAVGLDHGALNTLAQNPATLMPVPERSQAHEEAQRLTAWFATLLDMARLKPAMQVA
jgi:K+-sensing histidine kinase KdpD